MKKHISVKVLLVCVVILIAGAAARANSPAAGFDKILPFAGADNVRVEMTFRSDEPLTGVEFAGRIVPFKGGAPLWEGVLGRFDVKQDAANVLSQSITGLKPQLWSRYCCKDYFKVRKLFECISLCRYFEQRSDELRLPLRITSC